MKLITKLITRGLFLLLTCCSLQAMAAPRTVFVQLFEWPWQDVARECEIYLGPAGFSAVQISPPHEHIDVPGNPWWARYQMASYQLKSRSGDEADFTNMVQRCHNVGVDIYADILVNHAAGYDTGTGIAGSTFTHYNYPGIYANSDFHHCGLNGNDHIVNFFNIFELQNCELLGLADLATETTHVQQTLAAYMNHLLDLGVAGFRFDASKHVPAADLKALTQRLERPTYIFQELILNGEPLNVNDYLNVGSVTAYSYPFAVGGGFKNKNVGGLYNISQGLVDSTKAIVFMTNHDLERSTDGSLLSHASSPDLYKLAQIYMLAWPYGYPQVYSGFSFGTYDQGPPVDANRITTPVMDRNTGNCQAPWTCEHRDPSVQAMVDFRNQTNDQFVLSNWWTNGSDQIAFGRGNEGYVVINFSSNTMTQSFSTSLPAGRYCNILGSDYQTRYRTCTNTLSIDSNGNLNTTVPPMTAIALMQEASTARRQ